MWVFGTPATIPRDTVRAVVDDSTRARVNTQPLVLDGAADLELQLPTELRNRVARLAIENENSAGAVTLLDERWRRRPVGLVSGASLEKTQPLLGDTYYLERALRPFSEVRTGDLHEIKSPLILQPGPAALTDGVRAIAAVIRDWGLRSVGHG